MRYASFSGQTTTEHAHDTATTGDTARTAEPAAGCLAGEFLGRLDGLGGRRAWFDDLADGDDPLKVGSLGDGDNVRVLAEDGVGRPPA
jgi:hypothetical protein